MDNTRNPTQNGKTDVDQEVAVAASLKEDSKRRQKERQEVEAHVGGGRRHDGCGLWWRRAERVSSGRSVRFVSGVSWVIKRKLSGKKEERQPYETVVYVLVC